MNKINVFMDVDSVVLNTLQAMCDVYNFRHDTNVKPEQITTWNASEVFENYTHDDVEEIFKSKAFWAFVKVYDGMYECINDLYNSGKFEIIFTSIGSSENLAEKTMFLKREFPNIKNHILLAKNKGSFPGKSIVNMQNGVCVDDNEINLFTSNAKYNVMVKFDGDKEWNVNWNYDDSTVRNPDELYQELMSVWELENRL